MIGGLILLGAGGDALVRGSVGVAKRLQISPLFVGLVLVGFGTSTPELATSLSAALRDAPGIAIGNVIGSNIANILLILGLSAVMAPIACRREAFRRDGPMLAFATAVCIFFAMNGEIYRMTGLVFLAVMAGYIVYTYRMEREDGDESAKLHRKEALLAHSPKLRLRVCMSLAVGGVIGVVIGANLMVSGAVAAAHALGIRGAIIGLTVVALGTSLPELATSIVAARHGETQLALGNVIGSNLFNILAILGITATVHPLKIPAHVVTYDLWIMAAVTALLLIFARTDHRISKREGAAFLFLYASYIGFLVIRAKGLI